MKKHLIAAAVAAAVAVPAMAQNVTISGRLDAGYSVKDQTTAAGVKTETSAIEFSPWTTSRLTMSGTEDLGGGLKAGFNVEATMSGGATTIGDRQLNLTLSGAFGSILAGRTDSMIKSVYDAFDAGYSNNMLGSVDSLDAATNTTTRRDVTVRYTTPKMGGADFSVGVSRNTVEATGAAKAEDNSGEEFGVRYAAGALSAALAYRNVDNKTAAGASSTNKDLGLGVSYNLGSVVLFGQYFDNESKNKVANTKVDEQFYAIGIRVPVGAATVYASYVDGESKTGATKLDREGYQLGVKYDLSKRTYAYVAYGDEEADASATTKAKGDQLAIGLVHHF